MTNSTNNTEFQLYAGEMPVMDVVVADGKTRFTSMDDFVFCRKGDSFEVKGEFSREICVAIKHAYVCGLKNGRAKGKADLQAELKTLIGIK